MARNSHRLKRRIGLKWVVPWGWSGSMIPIMKRYQKQKMRVETKALLNKLAYKSSRNRLVKKVDDDFLDSPCGIFGCGYPACSYCFEIL